MKYGLQTDPSQDNSQWAPRQRPNAIAQKAIGGALDKGNAWEKPAYAGPGPTVPPKDESAAGQLANQGPKPIPMPTNDPTRRTSITGNRATTTAPVSSAYSSAASRLTPQSSASTRRPMADAPTTDTAETPDAGVDLTPTPLITPPTETQSEWTPPVGSLDPSSSKMAPRLITQGGKTYLTEHGKRRELQPTEIAAAQQYVTDFWAKNPTGFQEGVGPQSNDEYGSLYGVDTSGWNTEGWATPEYIAQDYGGVMSGWDAGNWADENMQTPKYVSGRIFSKYDPNDPAQVQAAMAELQQAYPGAEFDGKDKVTIPGLGTIDVIVGAGAPGASWSWQDLTNGGGGAASAIGGGGGTGYSADDVGSSQRWYTQNQQMGGDAAALLAQIFPSVAKELGANASGSGASNGTGWASLTKSITKGL